LRHRQFGLRNAPECSLEGGEIREQCQADRTDDAAVLKHRNLSLDELMATHLQGIADMASFPASDKMKLCLPSHHIRYVSPDEVVRCASKESAVRLVDQDNRA
jgi:hypothetical protein